MIIISILGSNNVGSDAASLLPPPKVLDGQYSIIMPHLTNPSPIDMNPSPQITRDICGVIFSA